MNVEALRGSTLNPDPELIPPKPEDYKRKHNFEEPDAKKPRMMESSDIEAEEQARTEEEDDRPECEYGTDCYRKNPQHFKQFKHSKSRKNPQHFKQFKHSKKRKAEEWARAQAEEKARTEAEERARAEAEEKARVEEEERDRTEELRYLLLRRPRGWIHPRMSMRMR